jgi:outer membrane protein
MWSFGDQQRAGGAGEYGAIPYPFSFGTPSPVFIGGYGTVLKQLFARDLPELQAGFNLTVPHTQSRGAGPGHQRRADAAAAAARVCSGWKTRCGWTCRMRSSACANARAQYQAATKARILQEQSLDAEQKKYAAGASMIYNVILTQRDLATARQNELAAEAAYAKSKVELDRVTGQTLNNNGVSLSRGLSGRGVPAGQPPAAQ